MAIAEANHMHFMARNNCIWGIASVCALWPYSAAMFDYPSGCVRMWVNATVTSWLVKANAMSQNCHSFYNLLADNPVSLWQRECLKPAANISQHPYEAVMPVFFPHFCTSGDSFRSCMTPSEQKTLKMNLLLPVVGEGLKDKKMSASMPFFFMHSDGTVAHYLKYISYLNETVGLWNQSKPVNVMCLCMDINGEAEPFYSHLSENGNIM